MRFPTLTAIVSVFRRPAVVIAPLPDTGGVLIVDAPPKSSRKVSASDRKRTKKRTRRVRDADGNLVERPKKRAKRKAAKRAPRKAKPAAEPAEPGALVPVARAGTRALAIYKPKLWTGEQFCDAAIAARYEAQRVLGDRWDLVPGGSVRMLIPAKCLSFRTAMGTRIRLHADRRFSCGVLLAGWRAAAGLHRTAGVSVGAVCARCGARAARSEGIAATGDDRTDAGAGLCRLRKRNAN